MRTISKKTKYGLQSLIALARRYGEGPVLIATLAKSEDIPVKFLELILLDLKNHGVLESRKGPGGGYLLSRSPDKITIGDIVRFMEGPLAPLPCANEVDALPCDECADADCCGTRIVMREVGDAISKVLDHKTLQNVVEQADAMRLRRQDIPMYEI